MNNEKVIEALEQQNEAIKGITERLGREIVNIDLIRISNIKAIAELKGKPFIDITNLNYDVKEVLKEAGYMDASEQNTNGIKGLLTWIDKDIKGKLNRREFIKVVSNVVTADKNGKVKDKIPYLKTSLKRAIEQKEKATQEPN